MEEPQAKEAKQSTVDLDEFTSMMNCEEEQHVSSTNNDHQQVPNGCLSITSIEEPYQSVFPYAHFNAFQSQCWDLIYNQDINACISAPTGSGKTAIFELAIVRMIQKYAQQRKMSGKTGLHKAVYMAPIKALCQEKATEWTNKFGKLGIKCKELTGDTELSNVFQVKDADIILTTPEKWDSVTRKWYKIIQGFTFHIGRTMACSILLEKLNCC